MAQQQQRLFLSSAAVYAPLVQQSHPQINMEQILMMVMIPEHPPSSLLLLCFGESEQKRERLLQPSSSAILNHIRTGGAGIIWIGLFRNRFRGRKGAIPVPYSKVRVFSSLLQNRCVIEDNLDPHQTNKQ